MPLYLEPKDVIADLESFKSVLIVSCPLCPQMSLAMQKRQPFIELFRHGFKTPAFEDYIQSIRDQLEQRGIRTDAFTMRLPSPFMCLWTAGQRRRLVERAKGFEAVLVLGCKTATFTAREALKDTDCQVFQAMRLKAMANATVRFRFPATVELDMHSSDKQRKQTGQGDPAGADGDEQRPS